LICPRTPDLNVGETSSAECNRPREKKDVFRFGVRAAFATLTLGVRGVVGEPRLACGRRRLFISQTPEQENRASLMLFVFATDLHHLSARWLSGM